MAYFRGIGLSVSQFFELLSDKDLRRFFDRGLLEMLDAVFGGGINGEDLERVAASLIDFSSVLGTTTGRKLVLSLIPSEKQAELRMRVGRDIQASGAAQWNEREIRELCEFFGLDEDPPASEVKLSVQVVQPRYGLFDHQRVAVNAIRPLLRNGERRAVLHLPTGVGKTRTAMHVVAEWLRAEEPSVVVWLASGRELLQQASAAFEEAWMHLGSRPVRSSAMWGDQEPALDGFTDGFLAVGLAKGWTMMSRDPNWAMRLSQHVRLVVFDEAHQSIAKTYKRLTEELTLDFRCALLGLTATPGRTWADIDRDGELAEFYSRNKVTLDLPDGNPINYLIENEYLARPKFRTLLAEPGFELSSTEMNRISSVLDIPRDLIAKMSMSEQYVTAVLQAIQDLLEHGHERILVFAATVDHARVLAAILLARKVHSSVVTSSTSKRARESAIRRFKSGNGEPMVLVNFGVLTTGFDAPRASAVVIARPTRSLVQYSQMVGRAIRGPKAGGTEACEILTVVDPGLPGFGDVAEAFLNWEDVWQ